MVKTGLQEEVVDQLQVLLATGSFTDGDGVLQVELVVP